MISRALDPVTRDKFVVVAARGKRECPPEVMKYVSLEQFPRDAQVLHGHPVNSIN
jgi:hypothetical protein